MVNPEAKINYPSSTGVYCQVEYCIRKAGCSTEHKTHILNNINKPLIIWADITASPFLHLQPRLSPVIHVESGSLRPVRGNITNLRGLQ